MKTINKDAIIAIEVSASFYQRLQALALSIHNIEDFQDKTVKDVHLETVLILLQTLDQSAEAQGLVSDVVPKE